MHVKFAVDRLSVAVRGHPLQPHVVEGKLLHGVRPGDCTWALEGKGGKRALVLTLEKAQAGLAWQGLLSDEAGKKKKALAEMAAGVEGVDVESLKVY